MMTELTPEQLLEKFKHKYRIQVLASRVQAHDGETRDGWMVHVSIDRFVPKKDKHEVEHEERSAGFYASKEQAEGWGRSKAVTWIREKETTK